MATPNGTNDGNGKKPTVPYPPFKTFLSTLDAFAQFMPHRIDTSVWSNFSGGARSQLLGAYKFFGLVKEDGSPTPELKKLADDRSERPELLREILKRSYADLLKLDLTKATPSSFDAELRKYGLEGETHRKATAFFLAAAKFTGLPLSPLLTKRGSMLGTRRKRPGAPRRDDAANGDAGQPLTPPNQVGGPSRQFSLPSGTVITLGTSVDAMHMPAEDRKIFFGLLEQLEGYDEPPEEERPEETVDEAEVPGAE